MTIGKAIKARRKELKMSVEELAKAIGKDRSTIYRYERGDIEHIPMELLMPIAKALKTSPKHLVVPCKKWEIDLDADKDVGASIETSSEWLSERAERWFDATDCFEFSDDEILVFYEVAKYIIRIQNFDDYDERMDFLRQLFKQLNK